ncbi:MAG: hypothetical protein JWN40_1655 [Phycisphaerales bacterium]|nr:hypothetical protein [Phycisphaerales bacterium]
MGKKPASKFDAFDLAIRQMSIQQLKKIGVLYQKSLTGCETREDYANRLGFAMKPAERIKAMRDVPTDGHGATAHPGQHRGHDRRDQGRGRPAGDDRGV